MNNPQYCIIVDGSCDLIQAVSKSQQLDNVKENRIDHQWSIFSQHGFVDLVWCLLEVQPLAKLPTLQRR